MNPRDIFRLTAALGALGAGAAATASAAVVAAQAAAAKRRPGIDPRTAPDLPAVVGDERDPLVRIVVLGDSIAAGVGAPDPADSLGGLVIGRLAAAGYRVQARSVAVPNSRTVDVKIQASRALITSETDPYDIALIAVGAMDATGWSGLDEVERATFRTVSALRNAGVQVVLATTPDLGAATAVRSPLRALWGRRSRQVARVQQDAAESTGARVVNLVETTGTAFAGDPSLLAEDGFHPSRDGYRAIAAQVAPAVIDTATRSRS
ncbi:SGNH/GDSL hydrolase family protein [Epidermidibacterium keratini]|uniref:SGNH/GDSL hydrolase family protein n=1 Tax=Epidermidibacterium keratini TaxID=1891644 RepID=A0A7L4YPT9_9ACTN|nr:SGNH/GDSL hydrolase family protein [Epidermidibacterium keratini]QHC01295.1 SGNH/GDSL hydrolase family protein [Epidermidibacterium keratini]